MEAGSGSRQRAPIPPRANRSPTWQWPSNELSWCSPDGVTVDASIRVLPTGALNTLVELSRVVIRIPVNTIGEHCSALTGLFTLVTGRTIIRYFGEYLLLACAVRICLIGRFLLAILLLFGRGWCRCILRCLVLAHCIEAVVEVIGAESVGRTALDFLTGEIRKIGYRLIQQLLVCLPLVWRPDVSPLVSTA